MVILEGLHPKTRGDAEAPPPSDAYRRLPEYGQRISEATIALKPHLKQRFIRCGIILPYSAAAGGME
jgi:hypothetical protein